MPRLDAKHIRRLPLNLRLLYPAARENAASELRWMKDALRERFGRADAGRLRAWTRRRGRHEPLQYILGTAYFGPLELTVRPGVLIPRWETAEWTERLCRDIVPRLAAPYRQTLRVIDLCTGSGCIALLMSTMLQHATIEGYDIAAASVRLANRNATRALREPDRRRVRFRLLDVQTERVDQVLRGATVVCANPPYIDTHRPIGLSLSARRWEPSRALVAEQAGDAIISRIVSRSVATPSVSLVAIEVDGQAQASRTMHMVDASWRTEALRDSAGVIRCVILLRSAHGS